MKPMQYHFHLFIYIQGVLERITLLSLAPGRRGRVSHIDIWHVPAFWVILVNFDISMGGPDKVLNFHKLGVFLGKCCNKWPIGTNWVLFSGNRHWWVEMEPIENWWIESWNFKSSRHIDLQFMESNPTCQVIRTSKSLCLPFHVLHFAALWCKLHLICEFGSVVTEKTIVAQNMHVKQQTKKHFLLSMAHSGPSGYKKLIALGRNCSLITLIIIASL